MSAQHTPPGFKADYLQAFREARADGRIGYRVLRNPRARMAAAETLCLRLCGDHFDRFRHEFAIGPWWQRMEAKANGSAA